MACSVFRNPITNEVMTVLAPNGKDSILFRKLVDQYKVDPETAFAVWAHTKTATFKAAGNVVLDENGEPRVYSEGLARAVGSDQGVGFLVMDGKLKFSYYPVLNYKTGNIGFENAPVVAKKKVVKDAVSSYLLLESATPPVSSNLVLQEIIDANTSLSPYARLLQNLFSLQRNTIPVSFSEVELYMEKGTAGVFSPSIRHVFLDKKYANGTQDPEVESILLLHELTHAVTTDSLFLYPEFNKKITALRKRALLELGADSEFAYYLELQYKVAEQYKEQYANGEFLAGAFSDPSFQEALKEILVEEEENTTLFSKFVDFILDLLGVSKNSLLGQTVGEVITLNRKNKAGILSDNIGWLRGQNLDAARSGPPRQHNGLKMFTNDYVKTPEGHYVKKGDTTVKVESVTGKLIPAMQNKQFTDDGKTPGQRKADQLWDKKPANMTLLFERLSKTPLTKDEFIELYDRNRQAIISKGTIFHKLVHRFISKDPTITAEINALMDEAGLSEGEFEWVTPQVIYKLLSKTGTDFIKERVNRGGSTFKENPYANDKLYTEKTVHSSILEIAGTIDLVIDHGNNMYSYYDIKTGQAFNREHEYDMFMFGNGPTEDLWTNNRNKAKLQLMWYAVMTKINNPEAKFRALELIHLPNYNNLDAVDYRAAINVGDYLHMIKNFLEKTDPVKYKELQELAHFDSIFDPETYNAVSKEQVRINNSNHDVATELHLKILRLQQLVLWDKNLEANAIKGYTKSRDTYQEIRTLMKEIIKLKGNKSINYAAWNTDMSWLDSWIGTGAASTNPYIQLYYKIVQEQKQEANNKYRTWRQRFDTLIRALAKEQGIPDYKFGIGKLIGGVDRQELFGWMIKAERFGDTLKHRFITESDPEWAEVSKSEVRKKFAEFVLDSVDQFFIDEKSTWINPATGKKQALANRKATERQFGEQVIELTNLDLAKRTGKLTADVFSEKEGEYYRGFMPKAPPTMEDIRREHGTFSRPFMSYLWNKYTTNYFEAFYDGWYETDEVIPMKYLGGGEIDANNNYSLDLEVMMDSFVKQHYYKTYLDQAYGFGKGLQMYLHAEELEDTSVNYKKTRHWIETSIDQHILGRKDIKMSLTQRGLRIQDTEAFKTFNTSKFLRSLKTFFAGPTMWLKPVSGMANFVFAYLVSVKESVKKSIGIDGPHTRFGFNDLRYGFSVARSLFGKDAMLGKTHENKAFVLMEQFRFMSDNYDWYTSPNQLMTAKNALFTTRTMYAFHTLPEEMISTAIFVAQLKAMKTPDGLSVWDHYKPVTKTDENGNVYKTYEWDGTVRGKVRTSTVDGSPEYVDLLGLTVEETISIKYLYERIHGGYRLDERTRLEYYAIGEMLMQFKKYLPSILKNIGASRGKREAQGYFEKKKDENTGEEYLQWTPQVIEGRYRLLVGLIMNYTGILTDKFMPNGDSGSKKGSWLRLGKRDEYNWKALSAVQKDDMRDFLITSLTFAMMTIGLLSMWDYKDEDSLKKLFTRIRDDFAGNMWPPEIMYNVINFGKPIAATKAYKLATSLSLTLWSGMYWAAGVNEQAFTQQGNLRGWKELQRSVHILSSWHDLQRFFQESDDITGPDWLEQNGMKQYLK